MLRDRPSASTVRAGSSSSSCRAARSCARPVVHRSRRRGTPSGSPASVFSSSSPRQVPSRACCSAFTTMSSAPGAASLHLGGLLDRRRAAAHRARPQPVDRPVAGDRDQPGDRARPLRIEEGGLAPHRDIDVLQHVLGLASVLQDTEQDAKKLRGGILIDDPQRGAVPGAGTHQGRGKLAACGICVHQSRPPPAAASGSGAASPTYYTGIGRMWMRIREARGRFRWDRAGSAGAGCAGFA